MKVIFVVTVLILSSMVYAGEQCLDGQFFDDCDRTTTGVCTPGCRALPTCPEGQIYNSCLGPQFGPGACTPGCVNVLPPPASVGPVGPESLCITSYCHPVSYSWVGNFAVAESSLANGYTVLGSSGPCLNEDRSLCPDIFNQAFSDMRLKALQANRAQQYE